MIRRWLVSVVVFTLLWTGTLWHDIFGLEVMPLLAKSSDLVRVALNGEHINRICTACTRETYSYEELAQLTGTSSGSFGELPCSCPAHVHSPSCLSKVDLRIDKPECSQQSGLVGLISQLREQSLRERFSYESVPTGILRRPGPAIYLINRTLLI